LVATIAEGVAGARAGLNAAEADGVDDILSGNRPIPSSKTKFK
jgi:hypothetical protein